MAYDSVLSRNGLGWKLSNSPDTEFCLDALEITLDSCRMLKIFQSDQGCQFTSTDFVARRAGREDQYQLVRQDLSLRQHSGGEAVAYHHIR
jgi:putative transposase